MTMIMKGAHIIGSDEDKSAFFLPYFGKFLLMFYIFPLFFINFVKSNAFGFPKLHSPV